MKTYGFGFDKIGVSADHRGKVWEFKSRAAAERLGGGLVIASSAKDLVGSNVTTLEMIKLYNLFFDNPAEKQTTKAGAANLMIALAQAKAVKYPANRSHKEEKAMEKQAKAPKAKKEKVAGNGRKGRNSMFDGRTFKPAAGLTENPRRETAKGFKSMAIILAHPQGISYEDFLAQGGRRVDLAWDLVRDRVVAV